MQANTTHQGCNAILTLGGRVRQGTTLTVLAVAAVGSGLLLGWDSLVALGLSTFIIALLPCVVMCALGVCASRMGRKDAASGAPANTGPKEPGFLGSGAVTNEEASPIEKIKAARSARTP